MSIEKVLNFSDGYGNYSTDANPTTYEDMHTFMGNQSNVLQAITNALLWQPSTAYKVGDVVLAPSMNGYVAKCTKAGTSGSEEPATWGTGTVTDNTVTWTMKAWSADLSGYMLKKPTVLWDVVHSLGMNYVPTDTSNASWNALGLAISYYDTLNKITNQPNQWGQLINIPATMDGVESTQLWINQDTCAISVRRGNAKNPVHTQAFKQLAFSADVESTYLKKTDASSTYPTKTEVQAMIDAITVGDNTGY